MFRFVNSILTFLKKLLQLKKIIFLRGEYICTLPLI